MQVTARDSAGDASMTGETVNFDAAASAQGGGAEGRTNERSTIAFPYLDLESAIDVVARIVFGRTSYNACSTDELAASMGQTAS